MNTKTATIKRALISGDNKKALSIASKFFDKSADTQLYKRAKSAIENPGFYRQLGKDPAAIIDIAVSRLKEVFIK